MSSDRSYTRSCRRIADRAGSLAWLHEETAKLYERRERACSAIVSVGTALLGGLTITFLAVADAPTPFILVIQTASLALGLFGIVGNSCSLKYCVAKHRMLVGKNDALFSHVRKELQKNTADRLPAKHILEQAVDMESDVRLERMDATIPSRVYEKYETTFGLAALPMEELVLIALEPEPEPEGGSSVSTAPSAGSESPERGRRLEETDARQQFELLRYQLVQAPDVLRA